MALEYEAEFIATENEIGKAKSLFAIFFGIAFVGLVLFVFALYLSNPSIGNRPAYVGVIAFFGFIPLVLFGPYAIYILFGIYALYSMRGAWYDINEERIYMRFRYKNKMLEWLFDTPRYSRVFLDKYSIIIPPVFILWHVMKRFYRGYYGRSFDYPYQNVIFLDSISILQYSEFQGKKSAYLEALVGPVNILTRQHIILPQKDPESCFKQLESWVEMARARKKY